MKSWIDSRASWSKARISAIILPLASGASPRKKAMMRFFSGVPTLAIFSLRGEDDNRNRTPRGAVPWRSSLVLHEHAMELRGRRRAGEPGEGASVRDLPRGPEKRAQRRPRQRAADADAPDPDRRELSHGDEVAAHADVH